jgi:hypothetical protein
MPDNAAAWWIASLFDARLGAEVHPGVARFIDVGSDIVG